ncbi:MAG: hypothetical protein WD876_02900 [Candidatus Pacearchaeota archaeon]
MFGKKTCDNCTEKVNKSFDFCPYCGYLFDRKSKSEDHGMLGRDDIVEEARINPLDAMLGGMSGKILNKMFNSAVKMLEKEMEKEFKNHSQSQNVAPGFTPRTNFEIIINGKRVSPENIKFTRKMLQPEKEVRIKRKAIPNMSPEVLKKISGMKKHEPSTNIRRLANKVIYEVDIPGVKSIDEVSITRLENSIEVKALAKTGKKGSKAYSKLIPLNLPITNYELEDGKLILELDTKN